MKHLSHTISFFTMTILSYAFASPNYIHQQANPEPCVRIVNAHEGNFTCAEFTKEEIAFANTYGLKLGSTHELVKEKLESSGWKLNIEELAISMMLEEGDLSRIEEDGLFCGSGWNAVCYTVMSKNGQNLYLEYISGGNEHAMLMSVSD